MDNSARKDEIANAISMGIRERFVNGTLTNSGILEIVQTALTSYEEERTPSGEGWPQRIAAMDPYVRDDKLRAAFCQFCHNIRHAPHDADCLWQNAKDTTPLASGGEGAT